MDDFSIGNKENYHGTSSMKFNQISPGKRPVSSQTPLIIVDNQGDIRLVIGGSGGNKIITSVAQVTLLNLLFNLNIKVSIDMPRVHHHLSPNKLIYEQSFDQVWFFKVTFILFVYVFQSVLNELKRRGHELKCTAYGGSIIQGIEWNNDQKQYWANSDVRKGGNPHGY